MKIVKIKSLNINSLKGEFEIDFEEFLKDDSLFAITGATGSGKSTILDIITCALYGKTARLTNPQQLMSRHTSQSLCEVEFEIKGVIYRSSWSIKRARKKPDGKFQPTKMEITDVGTGKVITSKSREVVKYVEELSGLDFQKFNQSMMLAQGSFDAFLKANENDRSSLLEKITGTYIYKNISKEIYDTHATHKKAIEIDEVSLGVIELLDIDVAKEKVESLRLSNQQKKELDKQESELKTITKWLSDLEKLQNDSIKYALEFEAISKTKEEQKEEFITLDLASKALNIEPLYAKKSNLSQNIEESKSKLNTLQIELRELKLLLITIEKKSKETKEIYAKEKIDFELNSKKLQECRTLQIQIESKKEALHKLKKKITKQQTQQRDIAKKLEAQNKKQESLESELKTIDTYLNQNQNDTALKEHLPLMESKIKAYKKETKKQKDIGSIEEITKQIENSTNTKGEKSQLLIESKKHLQTLQEKQKTEALIAKYEDDRAKLQDGEPCFVCGATNHPYSDETLNINPDKTLLDIKAKEREINKQSEALKTIEIELTTYSANYKIALELQKEITELKAELTQLYSNYSLQFDDNYENNFKVLKIRKEKFAQNELSQKKIEKNLHTITIEQKGDKTNLDILDVALKEDIAQTTLIRQEIEELKSKSKDILEVEDLEEFEKEITTRFNRLQEEHNSLINEVSKLTANDKSLTKQTNELIAKESEDSIKYKELIDKFEEALRENSFSSKEAFEKAILTKESREKLSTNCKAIDDKYIKIQTLKEDTNSKLKEQKALQLSDRALDEVAQELQILQPQIDELQKQIGSVEKELEINDTNTQKHKSKIEELDKKKEAFKVWIKLNEMIGSANGDKFSKFAQGITLDQLIYLANQHLEILSSRYELKRSEESNKLLEIEVIDSFQGNVARPVSTLSGGESFIVSLALALGLSALASQKISIDSLFLDEGFGTLDSDSLEMALNALNALQSSGKMVGVISHVEALKERIPLQIKVLPRGDGTSLLEY